MTQSLLHTLEEAKDIILGKIGTERRDKYESELANIKEFEIKMVVYNLGNHYTLEQINEMFIKFAESNDLYCGGNVTELSEELKGFPLTIKTENEHKKQL